MGQEELHCYPDPERGRDDVGEEAAGTFSSSIESAVKT